MTCVCLPAVATQYLKMTWLHQWVSGEYFINLMSFAASLLKYIVLPYFTYEYHALICYILSNIEKRGCLWVSPNSWWVPVVTPNVIYSFFEERLGLRLILFNRPAWVHVYKFKSAKTCPLFYFMSKKSTSSFGSH